MNVEEEEEFHYQTHPPKFIWNLSSSASGRSDEGRKPYYQVLNSTCYHIARKVHYMTSCHCNIPILTPTKEFSPEKD